MPAAAAAVTAATSLRGVQVGLDVGGVEGWETFDFDLTEIWRKSGCQGKLGVHAGTLALLFFFMSCICIARLERTFNGNFDANSSMQRLSTQVLDNDETERKLKK